MKSYTEYKAKKSKSKSKKQKINQTITQLPSKLQCNHVHFSITLRNSQSFCQQWSRHIPISFKYIPLIQQKTCKQRWLFGDKRKYHQNFCSILFSLFCWFTFTFSFSSFAYFLSVVAHLRTTAISFPQRLVSNMSNYASSGTKNTIHSMGKLPNKSHGLLPHP